MEARRKSQKLSSFARMAEKKRRFTYTPEVCKTIFASFDISFGTFLLAPDLQKHQGQVTLVLFSVTTFHHHTSKSVQFCSDVN